MDIEDSLGYGFQAERDPRNCVDSVFATVSISLMSRDRKRCTLYIYTYISFDVGVLKNRTETFRCQYIPLDNLKKYYNLFFFFFDFLSIL